MSTPTFIPVPPANVRLSLGPDEWEACLDAWITLSDVYLRLSSEQFVSTARNASFVAFLKTYYNEAARIDPSDGTLRSPKALALRQKCFSLCKRSSEAPKILEIFSNLDFLSHFSKVNLRANGLRRLLTSLWKAKGSPVQVSLQAWKTSVTERLSSTMPESVKSDLDRYAPLFYGCPEMAVFLLTGSDFLDAAVAAYSVVTNARFQKAILLLVYLGLVSCVQVEQANIALLSDHLYILKSMADSHPGPHSFLTELVSNTPLLVKVRTSISGTSDSRIEKLLDSLAIYQTASRARSRKREPKKRDKGKGRQVQDDHEIHVHQMSLVTQIQDLFPDLGAGFIMRLLDEYHDDVEQVTAHLLDDSLPANLRSLDRSQQAPIFSSSRQEAIDHLAPRSTPPPQSFIPERRNVFDNDELDRLEVDTARLHIGKKEEPVSSAGQTSKASILAALAAFDADDDERDDTYDVEDVGGTVDTAQHDGDESGMGTDGFDDNDLVLWKVFTAASEAFARTAEVRRSKPRLTLKEQTGMTDEAIEGWAIMLLRDPRRMRRLEARFGNFDGRQSELQRTAYREGNDGGETEDSDGPARGGYRGRGRGRGRGGRGGGRGGAVTGPSGDPGTATAQRRKEANKGSRANHNRRDQRAKKLARAGFPG